MQIKAHEIFIGFENENIVAFGILEKSKIIKEHGCIGMFTNPKYRNMNIGKLTLAFLIDEALKSKLKPVAGCWYLNHFSKRSLEGAGMITDTRYLKITF